MRNPLVIAVAFFAASFCLGSAAAQPRAMPEGGEPVLPAAEQVGPALVEGLAGLPEAAAARGRRVAVTTYHYDNLRTGWNPHEMELTAANFPSRFGLLATVPLDDQVSAQPLLIPNVRITTGPYAGTTHDVAYVVTNSNTVYAIDASGQLSGSDAILFSRNLGPSPPIGCGAVGDIGIIGTPVIDLAAATLYLVAAINRGDPSFELHALKLGDLTEQPGSPVTVSAQHLLTNHEPYKFDASLQFQRPALIEAHGNFYAAFGSSCEQEIRTSRGWVLGWNARTLAPLAANELTDTQATEPGVSSSSQFFVTGIWMSGYGLAGNGSDLFFSTGNSDCDYFGTGECPPKSTYDGRTHIQEGVVRLRLLGNMSRILSIFPPNNLSGQDHVLNLDQNDLDQGSGGVMLLPPQRGQSLAVTAGKDGKLYLLNALNMSLLDLQQPLDGSGCWCGPSYFTGPDGVGRVVTSYGSFSSPGSTLQTWKVKLSPSPHLVAEGTATVPCCEQDPGFFTVVSSNGTKDAIIWAVDRPGTDPSDPTAVHLYAFAAAPDASGTLHPLFPLSPAEGKAGSWPITNGNANIVPVVANGKVYVASYHTNRPNF